jgi:DNA polymerase I-like protein with 3'-5' exonuclease and polymerase domains
MSFQYHHETEWVMPEVFPNLSDYPEVAIDLETYDPDLKSKGSGWPTKNGYVIGVAVAVEDQKWYFPIRHSNGENLDARICMMWVRDLCSNPDRTYVFHNAMYDVGWLRAEGVEVKGRIVDTMIAAPLLDENRFSYSLNNLGKDYLNESKNERSLRDAAVASGLDPKAEMYKLPAHFVGAYAEQDASLTLRLWKHLEGLLFKQNLTSVFELETKVFRVIFEMRSRGVRVDIEKAEQIKDRLLKEENELLGKIKADCGSEVSIWAAGSIAKAFDSAGLEYSRTAKSNAPSFTKNFLNNHPSELAKMIVRARELNKARTTFIDSITRHSTNGRIHADVHQLRGDDGGTITGRFSYSNPNLQQIPSRDDFISPMIRGLFLPEEGEVWGSFDYSSQEPRIVVHYAYRLMPKEGYEPAHRYSFNQADTFVQNYREDPRSDFHQIAADIVGVPRKQAKIINLGLFYGMGVNKLAEQLGLDYDSGRALFKEYHSKVPFVRDLIDYATEQADKNGSIRTLLGRLGRFDKFEPRSFGVHKPLPIDEARKEYGEHIPLKRAFVFKALNKLIQGSAADQTKKAMVDLYDAGILPMIQIHDELAVSIKDKAMAHRVVEIMEKCVEMHVPSVVDAELGRTWGEAALPIEEDSLWSDPADE